MLRFLATVFIATFLIAPAALADKDATDLVGNWTNQSYDGVFTQLEIEADGKFEFREIHSADLRRSHMCGGWSDAGDELDLAIKQRKVRDLAGQIAESMGVDRGKIRIRSRSANRLVVVIDNRTIVLRKLAA